MKTIKSTVALFLAFAFLGSCTKDFKELNTNPNASEKALPEYLMARALVQVVANNMSTTRSLTNELMQVSVNYNLETDRVFRFDIANRVSEAPWNNWYVELTNFKDIFNNADEAYASNKKMANSFKGISLICQSWIYAMLTDTYGDIPYFNSNQGAVNGILTPKFDRQKDIYPDLFEKLEQANTLLSQATNVPVTSDPVYNGNITNWRKFGNSLYLRLLLRVSEKEDISDFVKDKIKGIVELNTVKYPMINNNNESAILKWTGVGVYTSPLVSITEASWSQAKACKYFVDGLLVTADPCIGLWLTKSGGEYEGIESGYVIGQTPVGRSGLSLSLKASPLYGNMLNYAEVQLMLAEAALRGLITGNETVIKAYYDNGITSRITQWGNNTTQAASYLSNVRVAWNSGQSMTEKKEKIFYQKYLALLFTDIQSWAEYRRTGYPVLPKGLGLLNDGIMPTRIYYPTSALAANPENYGIALKNQGPDNLKTLLWWQNRTY